MSLRTFAALVVSITPSLLAVPASAAEPEPPDLGAVLGIIAGQVTRISPIQRQFVLDLTRGYRLDLRPALTPYGDCWSQQIDVLVSVAPQRVDHPTSDPTFRELRVVNRFRPPVGDACGDPTTGRWTGADDAWRYHAGKRALDEIQAYAHAAQGKLPFAFSCKEFEKPCRDPHARLREAFDLGADDIGLNEYRAFPNDVVINASHTPLFAPNWKLSAKLGSDGHVVSVNLSYFQGPMP